VRKKRKVSAVLMRRPGLVPSPAETFEEIAHAGEEARRFGIVLRRGYLLELLEQLALAAGEVLWRLDHDLDVHVANPGGAQYRHALAAQAELLAGLRAVGNLHARLAAVDRRHLEFAAERGRGDRHRHRSEERRVGKEGRWRRDGSRARERRVAERT